MGLISAYAPHSGHARQERIDFFTNLSGLWDSVRVHGPKFVRGDLNSRLYTRFADEIDIVGDYYVQNERRHLASDLNRFFLSEFCHEYGTVLANTYFDKPLAK